MKPKAPPGSFSSLTVALHQDARLFHGGTLEEQAEECADDVPPDCRAELASYLDGLLERRDSGELRRLLRKQDHVAVGMSKENWWLLLSLVRGRLVC